MRPRTLWEVISTGGGGGHDLKSVRPGVDAERDSELRRFTWIPRVTDRSGGSTDRRFR